MSGMTVAVLQPYGLLYRIVKILCPDYPQDRHHQLLRDQRMLLRSFKGNAPDIVRYGYADHAQQSLCVSSDTFSVQASAL